MSLAAGSTALAGCGPALQELAEAAGQVARVKEITKEGTLEFAKVDGWPENPNADPKNVHNPFAEYLNRIGGDHTKFESAPVTGSSGDGLLVKLKDGNERWIIIKEVPEPSGGGGNFFDVNIANDTTHPGESIDNGSVRELGVDPGDRNLYVARMRDDDDFNRNESNEGKIGANLRIYRTKTP